MNKFNGRRRNVVKERNQEKRVTRKRLGLKQKHELGMKLVSGTVRSGKGKKKAEKAARRAEREKAAVAAADATMGDAPKATKGLKPSSQQPSAGVASMDTEG